MRILFWKERPDAWVEDQAYRAGELVAWRDRKFVCVNGHTRGVLPPHASSLWAQVIGRYT